MTTPTAIAEQDFRNMSYGYLWWIINSDKNIYAAIGNSGNVIYIDSENSMVIAVTAYFKPTIFDRIDFLENTIKPFLLQLHH